MKHSLNTVEKSDVSLNPNVYFGPMISALWDGIYYISFIFCDTAMWLPAVICNTFLGAHTGAPLRNVEHYVSFDFVGATPRGCPFVLLFFDFRMPMPN